MPVFLLHAGSMVVGFVLMATGVMVAMSLRTRRWWLKTHRLLGSLGAASAILGLIAAIIMVSLSSGHHLSGLHPSLGSVTVLAAAVTPTLGALQFRLRNKKIRVVHRWAGRFTIVLGAGAVVTGLHLAGIL